MNDDEKKAIVQHIRGATVVHTSPFSSIQVPTADDILSLEECDKFVSPFYRVSFRSVDGQFIDSLKAVYREIKPTTVERLLTEYDWRPRLTGAFFAALKSFNSCEDHIGRLLIRSDLCFAGKLYCVALAEFNSPIGLDYLRKYLEYYLTRPELDYDQGDAMGAIAYLDAKNGTKIFESFQQLWNNYIKAKSWKPDLEKNVFRFAEEMRALHELRLKNDTNIS
jgi:hypothetical protein